MSKKIKSEETLISSPGKDQDYNLIENKSTLSYFQNFAKIWDIYMGIFLGFCSTLMAFPVLVFQMDISSLISDPFKFVFLCFIYSLGDISSRLMYSYLPLNSRFRLHAFNLFKLFLVYLIYFVVRNPGLLIMSSLWLHLLFVFLVGFGQGVVIVKYSILGKKLLENKPYDLNKMGHISINMSYIGLCVGSLLAYIMF